MSKVKEHFFPELYNGEVPEVNNEFEDEATLQQCEAEYAEHQRKCLDEVADIAEAEIRAMEKEALRHSELIDRYWVSMIGFLGAVGGFSWIVKLEYNSHERGIFPAQVVEYDYFKDPAALAQSKEDRRREVWHSIRELNRLAQQVGVEPTDDRTAREIVNFLIGRIDTENAKDPGVRRKAWFRDNVNRLRARGELRSLKELYQRRKELEE